MIALFIVFLAFVSGVLLLVRGLRGRSIGTHPLCRRCGFDLFGLPKESTQCSECGADITAKGAVRIGHRRPRRVMAGVGLLLAMLAIGFLIAIAADVAQGIPWIQYEPLGYVRSQAADPAAPVHDPALAELTRRLTVGKLSDSSIRAIANEDLAIQANPTAPWSTGRGDFLQAAHSAGKLPETDWKQYLSNAPQLSLAVRANVRRGDTLPIRITTLAARTGKNSSFWAKIQRSTDDPLIDPQDRRERGWGGLSIGAMSNGSIGQVLNLDQNAATSTGDGEKTLRLTFHVSLYNQYTGEDTPPLATRDIALSAKWNLLPADAKTVTAIKDPSLRPAVEKAVRVELVKVYPWSSREPNALQASLQVAISSTPASLAHELVLRSGSHEWPLKTGIYIRSGGSTTWGTGGSVSDFQVNGKMPEKVDVVFRPSLKQALDTVDLRDYWDGEFVVKDVKVEREEKN